jgi:hypothetical protein
MKQDASSTIARKHVMSRRGADSVLTDHAQKLDEHKYETSEPDLLENRYCRCEAVSVAVGMMMSEWKCRREAK